MARKLTVGIDHTNDKVTLRVDDRRVVTVSKGDLSRLLSRTCIYVDGEEPEEQSTDGR